MSVVADLHTHTTVTDGRVAPKVLIRLAAEAGLEHLVITDHSIVTWDGLRAAACTDGIDLPFPGTELSTVHRGRRYHLLIFGNGVLDMTFQERVKGPLRWRNSLLERTRVSLVERGFSLPPLTVVMKRGLPGLLATPEKRMASRTALAAHLVATSGMALDQAYELVRNTKARVEDELRSTPMWDHRYLPTLDVLVLADRHNATAVLAHPLWQCRNRDDISEALGDLELFASQGLAAVESRSYHHRPLDDHPDLLCTRDRLGLLPSGGSDFHANGETTLGNGGLGAGDFTALADLVFRRNGARVSRQEARIHV